MDCSSGLFAALAVVLGLNMRKETGKGQKIEVALFETAALLMSLWLVYYTVYGTLPPRLGSGHLVWAPYGLFKAAGGEMVFIGVASEKHWTLLCKALDLTALAEDPKFQTMEKRVANKRELAERLEEALKNLKAAEVVVKLTEFGVPAAPLNTLDRVVEDEHLNKSGAFFKTKLDDNKLLKLPLIPLYSETPIATLTNKPPKLGEDTVAVLKSIGYSDSDIENFKLQNCI